MEVDFFNAQTQRHSALHILSIELVKPLEALCRKQPTDTVANHTIKHRTLQRVFIVCVAFVINYTITYYLYVPHVPSPQHTVSRLARVIVC